MKNKTDITLFLISEDHNTSEIYDASLQLLEKGFYPFLQMSEHHPLESYRLSRRVYDKNANEKAVYEDEWKKPKYLDWNISILHKLSYISDVVIIVLPSTYTKEKTDTTKDVYVWNTESGKLIAVSYLYNFMIITLDTALNVPYDYWRDHAVG